MTRRVVPATIIGLLGLFLAVELWVAAQPGGILSGSPGFDFDTYLNARRGFFGGDGFYASYQLTGPSVIMTRDIVYPPITLALLIRFTILPAVLWWAISLGISGWVIAWHHPSRWGYGAMLALLLPPVPLDIHFSHALHRIVTGNPAMWVLAAVAAATRWGWPGAFVHLKPSLRPLAAIGVRTRGWWMVLAGMIAWLGGRHAPRWRPSLGRNGANERREQDPQRSLNPQ